MDENKTQKIYFFYFHSFISTLLAVIVSFCACAEISIVDVIQKDSKKLLYFWGFLFFGEMNELWWVVGIVWWILMIMEPNSSIYESM